MSTRLKVHRQASRDVTRSPELENLNVNVGAATRRRQHKELELDLSQGKSHLPDGEFWNH